MIGASTVIPVHYGTFPILAGTPEELAERHVARLSSSSRPARPGRLGPSRARMVVTPHPLATAAGVEALRAGGTAVDAAVAANAMLAVVYCNACGLGGDAFALVWDPGDSRLHGFNGSGRSPAALTIDAARSAGRETMPARGPLPIDVPGAVDAWAQLLDRFGRRTLADALSPAAEPRRRATR